MKTTLSSVVHRHTHRREQRVLDQYRLWVMDPQPPQYKQKKRYLKRARRIYMASLRSLHHHE